MKKLRDHRNISLRPIHSDGEPIPREFRERFTKPKDVQELFQVFVDEKNENGKSLPLPVGPKIGKEAAEMILVAVNSQLCLGKLPTWGNARLEPCFSS